MTEITALDEISRQIWQLPGRGARLIVDLDAIEGNVRVIRDAVGPHVRVLAVVKANGYGTGSVAAARAAIAGGASWLGVATVREASMLRDSDISTPILVLGPTMPAEAEQCVSQGISLTIGCEQYLIELLRILPDQMSGQLGVHMKIDTGMHRFGIEPDRAVRVANSISANPAFRLEGVFTHFARADEPEVNHTARQADLFQRTVGEIESAGIDPGIVHVSNSAAVLLHRQLDFDMVRPGICIYGVAPGRETPLLSGMRTAVRIEAVIQRVSSIPVGDEVGYGGQFRAKTSTSTVLLSLGYADGYRRAFTGNSWAGFQGERLLEIGRVSMDQTIFALTDSCHASYGDVVYLVGDGANGEPTVEELAELADTIPYEILTGFGQRLPVFYLKSDAVVAYDNN